MASNSDRKWTGVLALAATAVSATLFYLGTGEKPFWWATWLAPLPLLLVAPRLRATAAFGTSAAAWFVGGLNMLHYVRNILSLPNKALELTPGSAWFSVLLFMVLPACAFGLAVVLFRSCARRRTLWHAVLVFPSAWVVVEYLSSMFSPHGTFGSLAYTQMAVLPLLQITSVTGLWGICFLIFLVPAAITALFVVDDTLANKRTLAAGITAILALVVAFGAWRMHANPGIGAEAHVEVGLVASDLPANLDISDPGGQTRRKMHDYLLNSGPLIDRGAKVVILPEKLGVTVPATSKDDDVLFQSFADRGNADVLLGIIRLSGTHLLNEARLYEPQHSAPRTYDKHHMLPAFESQLTPGVSELYIERPSGLWGVAICKDMDFPDLSRKYGSAGIGLLLVPAWDFGDDDWLHARMAVMRGVESGFSIARSAKEGLLTVSDSCGRILAHQSSKASAFSSLSFDAPVHHVATLYVRYGNWFAWVCITLVLVMGLPVTVSRKRLARLLHWSQAFPNTCFQLQPGGRKVPIVFLSDRRVERATSPLLPEPFRKPAAQAR
jgi:apolipoprotein N-acyltransferase